MIFNNSNNYSNNTCISQDKLSKFTSNKKDYVTINKYTKCDPKFCGHDCDKGDYCVNNECIILIKDVILKRNV